MIDNWAVFTRFLVTFLCFLVYLSFLIPRQAKEVLLPTDGLTKLRWYLLSILLVIMLTLIPSIVSQFFTATGHNYSLLKNVSAIVGAINLAALTILFVMVYIYRRKD